MRLSDGCVTPSPSKHLMSPQESKKKRNQEYIMDLASNGLGTSFDFVSNLAKNNCGFFFFSTLPLGIRQEFPARQNFKKQLIKRGKSYSLESKNNTVALGIRLLVKVNLAVNHGHDTITELGCCFY